jgi:hypothetical protein
MSLAEILEEVEHLSDTERAQLARQLWARELAADPERTADLARRLDRQLSGQGFVTEEEFRARLAARE